MNDIIIYETGNETIQVEAFENTKRSRGKEEDKELTKKFDVALNTIKTVGEAVIKKVKEIGESPDEVSIELGVKFSAETGAIIAKTSAEGTLKVTFKWQKSKTNK